MFPARLPRATKGMKRITILKDVREGFFVSSLGNFKGSKRLEMRPPEVDKNGQSTWVMQSKPSIPCDGVPGNRLTEVLFNTLLTSLRRRDPKHLAPPWFRGKLSPTARAGRVFGAGRVWGMKLDHLPGSVKRLA